MPSSYSTTEKETKEPVERFPRIYDYIIQQEASFRTQTVPLGSNWNWNMYRHIDRSFHLKNSQFYHGANNQEHLNRPFNNIIIPIANVNYRSEGFDVKDVELYVDDKDYFHLSLLARKYHNKWAVENSIDTAIDESVESYFDYGLALLKNVNDKRPEVVELKTQLAFCDQTNILAGPICLKHEMSIDELLEMKGKWIDEEVDRAILYSKFEKKGNTEGDSAQTPGKNVEIYELHGVFPESWLGEDYYGQSWEDNGKYTRQMHIITYYTGKDDKKNGICLYKGEHKQIFKALRRDKVEGRACGRGGIEELFHPQIWANYSEVNMQQMLDNVSKIIGITNDKKLAQNNRISNVKNGQWLVVEEGKEARQFVFTAPNKNAFDNYVNKWEQRAAALGSASDPQLGKNPVSGTPLGTTEIVVNQGEGIHQYRQGKIATFWGEIYRDWVINYLKKDLNKGDEWLDELSLEELQEVAERVSINESNKRIKDLILSGNIVTPEEQQMMREVIKEGFANGGKRRFIKIMKGEFEKLPLKIRFSISGKQKNMAEMVSKLNAIFRTVFTPGGIQMIQQNEGLAELLNNILESAGLSPVNFSAITKPVLSPIQPTQVPQINNLTTNQTTNE